MGVEVETISPGDGKRNLSAYGCIHAWVAREFPRVLLQSVFDIYTNYVRYYV